MKAIDGFVGQRVRMRAVPQNGGAFSFWKEGLEGTVERVETNLYPDFRQYGLAIRWDVQSKRVILSTEGDTLDFIEPTSPTVPLSKSRKGELQMFEHKSTRFDRKQDGASIFEQGRVTELYAVDGDHSYTVDNGAGNLYLVQGETCSCPDYQYRRFDQGESCKHVYAVNAFIGAKHPSYSVDEATVLSLVAAMEAVATDLAAYPGIRTRRAADTLRSAVQSARAA